MVKTKFENEGDWPEYEDGHIKKLSDERRSRWTV
jgi:hypothetical protein